MLVKFVLFMAIFIARGDSGKCRKYRDAREGNFNSKTRHVQLRQNELIIIQYFKCVIFSKNHVLTYESILENAVNWNKNLRENKLKYMINTLVLQ